MNRNFIDTLYQSMILPNIKFVGFRYMFYISFGHDNNSKGIADTLIMYVKIFRNFVSLMPHNDLDFQDLGALIVD